MDRQLHAVYFTNSVGHAQRKKLGRVNGTICAFDMAFEKAIPFVVSENARPLLCRVPRGYLLVVPAILWQQLDRHGTTVHSAAPN